MIESTEDRAVAFYAGRGRSFPDVHPAAEAVAVGSETASGRSRRVLVVEDDDVARTAVRDLLIGRGYGVECVGTGEDALTTLQAELYDVVLLDLHLPGMNGLSVLAAAAALQTDAQFIVMTSSGTIDSSVEAMKLGACDYIVKPLRANELLGIIDRACEETDLRREVAQLGSPVTKDWRSRMIGRSPAIQRVFDLIERVAPMRATVIITGETGTGKELVARAIHELSGRARRPFVPVNCSALSESLLESELFGHVKGSFTGAIASKRGLFEEAAGGTLFLDEIATITQHIQVKLLRVLEEHAVQRVGSTQSVPIDFRLIAATNDDLVAKVEAGEFREDLYYRLNVFPVHVPPLRDRVRDIPLLANHFLLRFAEENGLEPPEISSATLSRMVAHHWPGNVRELENFIERAVIMYAGAKEIRFEPPSLHHRGEHDVLRRAADEDWSIERLEREYILSVLERTGGHQGNAASILGIDRRTLYRKLRAMEVRVVAATA